MLWITVIIILAMAAINFAISGKAVVYPAFVFCCVWGIDLLLIAMSGDFFYRMSDVTLLLFTCGALVFSLGSALALLIPLKPYQPQPIGKSRDRLLTGIFWVLVLLTPLAIRYVVGLVGTFDAPNILVAASRMASESNESGGDTGYSLF